MDAREKKRSTKELLNILYCENGSYRIGELLDIIKELKTREEVDINIVLSFEECIFNVYQERKDKEDEMISLEEIRQNLRNKGIEDLKSAGARILSNKKKIINGKSCYVTEIYHQQKQVSYTFKENGVMHNIRFTSPNNWIDYNKGEIDKIIQTF